MRPAVPGYVFNGFADSSDRSFTIFVYFGDIGKFFGYLDAIVILGCATRHPRWLVRGLVPLLHTKNTFRTILHEFKKWCIQVDQMTNAYSGSMILIFVKRKPTVLEGLPYSGLSRKLFWCNQALGDRLDSSHHHTCGSSKSLRYFPSSTFAMILLGS